MQISFHFTNREQAPERLVADAEVIFGEGAGPFAGLRLVGFSLWGGDDGELYVTVPARSFTVGTERRYYDYLRGDGDVLKRLKAALVAAYRAEGRSESAA